MRTFGINVKDTTAQTNGAWLSKYTVHMCIRNIGVAFPLTLEENLQDLPSRSQESSVIRAFLLSIKSPTLCLGEFYLLLLQHSLTSGTRFRQYEPADFSGENHQTWNRLIYPEMTARLISHRSATSRQIRIGASVSGFVLDLDSTIPDYVFSLVEVYREGKARVARFTTLPRSQSNASSSPSIGTADARRPYTPPTSNVLASLTFLSGKVRVYSGAGSALSNTRRQPHTRHDSPDEPTSDFGAEILNLPVVSVWAEYRTTRTPYNVVSDGGVEPSILIFKSTVHSSQNSLKPVLLPFVTELVNQIDVHMRRTDWRNAPLQTNGIEMISGPPQDGVNKDDATTSVQISFSLRIDQSRLELTCQPDVNVIAGLHWESGGFVVNISPGARKATFTGSVGGLTVGLKHGFLSEDCVRLDARNLAFSITFARMEFETGNPISISIIVDTEFAGGVRFSRLQDVLCFKAVWLDRIPMFTGQDGIPATSLAKYATPEIVPKKSHFATAFLLRIRHIQLDVELGQSISAVTLDLSDALVRTKLTSGLDEVFFSVADVSVHAKGNVSGRAKLPDFVFQTFRRAEPKSLNLIEQPKMLQLTMTSGALDIMLETEHQQLLQYQSVSLRFERNFLIVVIFSAEPLEVEIFDDWSLISPFLQLEDQSLRLSFVVIGTEIVAAVTIGTIPKLLLYANKFKANLDTQREGASRESQTFRVTRSPKPENALTSVAQAMLHSARIRFKEAEAGLSYVIQQHLSFRLNLFRLAVFPRTMADPELARFVGSDVHARLDRLVESNGQPPKTDMLLSISSIIISKHSQLNHSHAASPSPFNGTTWLNSLLENASEAIIVGLPSMHMHMSSQQIISNSIQTLVYDFHSQFIRLEGMRDQDIYITLNMALYSWLTLLRKNLSREMDQVQAPAQKVPDQPFLADEVATLHESLFMATTKSSSPAWNSDDEQDMHMQSSPTTTALMPQLLSHNTLLPKMTYQPHHRHIERLTMRQLGEATPDVMHPFFMKKAGFNLEDALPQYVHEYATVPLREIMEILLKLYSKQLQTNNS